MLEVFSIQILCPVKGTNILTNTYYTFVLRQDKVDGPCRNWYNETFLESLNPPRAVPSAISANRVVNQENRRRPSRPALPRRQNVVEALLPEEPLPQQLADLERFGQTKGN